MKGSEVYIRFAQKIFHKKTTLLERTMSFFCFLALCYKIDILLFLEFFHQSKSRCVFFDLTASLFLTQILSFYRFINKIKISLKMRIPSSEQIYYFLFFDISFLCSKFYSLFTPQIEYSHI